MMLKIAVQKLSQKHKYEVTTEMRWWKWQQKYNINYYYELDRNLEQRHNVYTAQLT